MTDLVVGASTPIVSAVIAGLVALLVVNHEKRNTLEAWVMDRRYELYGELLDAIHAVLASPLGSERAAAMQDPERIRAITRLIHRLDLLAPAAIAKAAEPLYDTCWKPLNASENRDAFRVAANSLLDALQGSLVPDHMK